MKIQEIINRINRKLANEQLSYTELKPLMDDVIDDINEDLGSTYPAFSDLDALIDTYDAFPDQWIRQVVIFGAAHYFYLQDEEGIISAPGYEYKYRESLFKMTRDMTDSIPEIYLKGYVDPATLAEDEVAPIPQHGTIDASGQTLTLPSYVWRL